MHVEYYLCLRALYIILSVLFNARQGMPSASYFGDFPESLPIPILADLHRTTSWLVSRALFIYNRTTLHLTSFGHRHLRPFPDAECDSGASASFAGRARCSTFRCPLRPVLAPVFIDGHIDALPVTSLCSTVRLRMGIGDGRSVVKRGIPSPR